MLLGDLVVVVVVVGQMRLGHEFVHGTFLHEALPQKEFTPDLGETIGSSKSPKPP